jgi:hypothetical protein
MIVSFTSRRWSQVIVSSSVTGVLLSYLLTYLLLLTYSYLLTLTYLLLLTYLLTLLTYLLTN